MGQEDPCSGGLAHGSLGADNKLYFIAKRPIQSLFHLVSPKVRWTGPFFGIYE